MPFSSDGDTIDFIYGVINWKDVGEAAETPQVDPRRACRRSSRRSTRPRKRTRRSSWSSRWRAEPRCPSEEAAPTPHLTWEDGPLADAEPIDDRSTTKSRSIELDADAGLADRLWAARESAEVCKQADGRSRAALYRALAMAYDFAVAAKRVPDDYAEILDDAGVKAQARAPMTPIVKLVFGIDYDKTRLTEFAAALSYAERENVDFGGFQDVSRAGRGRPQGPGRGRAQGAPPATSRSRTRPRPARPRLRAAPPIALAQLPTNEEFALVLTRRNANGIHEVVELVADAAMLDRALRRAAALDASFALPAVA